MAGINNTPFTPDSDIVAQLTGSGALNPGFTGPSTTGAGITPVYAATIALAPFLVKSRFIIIPGVNATSATTTLNTAYVAPAGAILGIQINAAGGTVTATFGTGFRKTGTAAPTVGTSILVHFQSDGTTWNEYARSAAALA